MANNRYIKLSINTLKPKVDDFWFKMSSRVKTIKDLKPEISAHLSKHYKIIIDSNQLDLFTKGGKINDYILSDIFTTHDDIEIRRKLSDELTKTEEIEIIQLDDEVDTNPSHQLVVKQEVFTNNTAITTDNYNQLLTTSIVEIVDSDNESEVSQQNNCEVNVDYKVLDNNENQQLMSSYLKRSHELENYNLNDNRVLMENVDNFMVNDDDSVYHKNNGQTIRLEEQTNHSDNCLISCNNKVFINLNNCSEDSDNQSSGQSSDSYKEVDDSNDNEIIDDFQQTNNTNVLINDKTSYKCQECDQTFGRNCQLKRHLKLNFHKQFQCPYYGCDAIFRSRYWLIRHQQSHHKNNIKANKKT
ncbi:putative uncharacterized protein DDB_G0267716 [Oppia nitens]|uniref:putative uncharacterized protein DDB_G0267716 n=1 Tax=Oppia nitens TaxID=1686743 RepID=UPI0023DBA88D|nr:putative uncharacterized protein DDB_G0267716 [Oppia nitens]